MRCEEFEKRTNEYIDKELGAEEELRFRGHLKDCSACSEKLRVYETLSDSIKKTKEELPEGVEIKLPDKNKGTVIKFIRRHQGLVSAMVAVVALLIFSGGIDNDNYKPSTVEDSGTHTKFSAVYDTAETEDMPTADMALKNGRMGTMPAYGIDNVLEYTMPTESEFKDKQEYKRLSELISNLKEKATNGHDENEIITEFVNILNEIEAAKNSEN